ncbi:sodium/bile acid cotransporter 7 [Larkinella arboricola]|uniref:Sodium/bile acid cotransporter 7 n=1 Tax=Larkinella arboricola TaxID=643671 RepID=A0A327WSZ0_LARAB|nr:bile acid:sodium symporter family protein [Larkinella arboricola]RAJ95738.1 sodium/bile acid cotransporter 7 [Larkinella arboricola]
MKNHPTSSFSFSSISALAARAGLDWFLLALLGMIGLAYLWPEPGIQEGPFSLSNLANIGVSVIFFFYGLRLSGDKLRAGLSNWKLHFTIHLTTFVVFPLIILAGLQLFGTDENRLLWLGTFYVAALPSTVSSSVVMVSLAGGNIPAAIFNASISSLIGVFITPLWMGLFLSTGSADYDLGSVIGKLALQVIVPVVLGIVLNRWLGAWAERHKKALSNFDKIVILVIVYTSFCESFERRMFQSLTASDLVVLGACMLGLFFLIYALVNLASRLLGFNREDRITALFCGSKKSLVQGSVMVTVLFPDNVVGIVLLPIMMYHALQLIAASILAQSMARQASQFSA